MRDKRYASMLLAFVLLLASILACNAPRPTPRVPLPPPATVTPYTPATPSSPDELQPPPTEPETELTATPEQPPATDTLPPPPATEKPAPTPSPTEAVSEGPLDFDEPRWIHGYEKLPDGGIKVAVIITIIGGAPPFTIKHEGDLVGETVEREYVIQYPRHGCSPIVYNITVDSADGQSKVKEYYIHTDLQPWCAD